MRPEFKEHQWSTAKKDKDGNKTSCKVASTEAENALTDKESRLPLSSAANPEETDNRGKAKAD